MAKKTRNSAKFLYCNPFGRMLLKPACSPALSRLCGMFLDSDASRPLAKRYIKKYHINTGDYYGAPYRTFNSCFTRKIREDKRPIETGDALISPCDGYLSAYHVNEGTVLPIKQSCYTLSSLLDNSELASEYDNGTCLVFRLNVDNYHRYCYIDDGVKSDNVFIPGCLHSVRPVALERYPVFIRNSREYTIIDTEHFGSIVQMEVGALLVGRIHNYHNAYTPHRGEEKGFFEYGGSTVILLFKDGQVSLPESIFADTENGIEAPVKLGQAVGRASSEE